MFLFVHRRSAIGKKNCAFRILSRTKDEYDGEGAWWSTRKVIQLIPAIIYGGEERGQMINEKVG
jgi:hypothetical protein